MYSSLLVNIMIILAIIVCMVVLQNPLALLGLLLLQQSQQPSMLLPDFGGQDAETEDAPTPMGFTADVK